MGRYCPALRRRPLVAFRLSEALGREPIGCFEPQNKQGALFARKNCSFLSL